MFFHMLGEMARLRQFGVTGMLAVGEWGAA